MNTDTNLEMYYSLEEFKESNDLFENFLSKCTYSYKEKVPQDPFTISTMTVATKLCDEINLMMVYQRLRLDNDIAYIERSKDSIRGSKNKKQTKYKIKTKKKNNNDKRKIGKGSPFSNQISIGFICCHKDHNHKNPICVKLFKNGKVHMTGCKNLEEVENFYTKLYNKVLDIKIKYTIGDRTITILPVKNIKEFKDVEITIDMVNGTFKTNFKIDLNKLYAKLKEVYTEEDLFINCEKKTQLVCYLKKYKIVNIEKRSEKQPSVFIYNSGSINVIAVSLDVLEKSYKLISEFIDKHYDELVEVNIEYDESFFTQD